MQKAAAHPEIEEHPHPEPLPRDPDLPAVSDRALMFFAAAALIATAGALLLVPG
jgi:hypothetical protein